MSDSWTFPSYLKYRPGDFARLQTFIAERGSTGAEEDSSEDAIEALIGSQVLSADRNLLSPHDAVAAQLEAAGAVVALQTITAAEAPEFEQMTMFLGDNSMVECLDAESATLCTSFPFMDPWLVILRTIAFMGITESTIADLDSSTDETGASLSAEAFAELLNAQGATDDSAVPQPVVDAVRHLEHAATITAAVPVDDEGMLALSSVVLLDCASRGLWVADLEEGPEEADVVKVRQIAPLEFYELILGLVDS